MTVDLSRLPRYRKLAIRRLVSALALYRCPDVDAPGELLAVERELRALGMDPKRIGANFRLVLG